MKPQVLIAGTGRAGTTLLVQLMDALDQETSLRVGNIWIDQAANAGLENGPFSSEDPRIVKSPWAYLFIDELMRDGKVKLDAVIVPIRNIRDAVSSRVILEFGALYRNKAHPARQLSSVWHDNGTIAGGVTYSLEPLDQLRTLATAFYETVEICVRHDIPLIFLEFPRFALDSRYAYEKLSPILQGDVSIERFEQDFKRIVSQDKIRVAKEISAVSGHTFSQDKLPSLEQLDKIALLRQLHDEERKGELAGTELQKLKHELEQVEKAASEVEVELQQVRDDLDLAKHSLARSQQENAALSARIAAMEAEPLLEMMKYIRRRLGVRG